MAVRYMIGRPLNFSPGTQFAYSNFGYCLLGRIIEAATGQSYTDAVRRLVLAPLDLAEIRPGRDLPADRPADESDYYPKSNKDPSVFRSLPGL
jgi:D-alanyl-D-alanine carboxypeptidase